jgi:two-component system phosphate regulon sensor histidine kinase PhoR
LLLNFAGERPPDDDARDLALLVASQCAIAIDRARVDEERERLLGEVRAQAAKLASDVTALEDLQERREDLVRTISHDLRTPLTAILGQAQLLVKRAEQPDLVRQGAGAIVTSANRMNVLIQDLVDMTRAESGQIRLEPKPVELLPFLEDLRERFRWALDVDRIRLEVPAGLPAFAADPGRLERILLNLLSNALKYSPPEREVLVRGFADGDGVAIEVEDRGQGIDPEDLPRVFDRFFRAGRVRKTEGLGLGLYIARLLVEAQGGTLRACSVPGEGSVFTARFPPG